jgi:NAD(P)-dependent dehydrogenase (short-subunit alcohol dehydrogenase family)
MLKGKVAIVTGGGSGIGSAIVSRFAREGANVLIAEIHEENGTQMAIEAQQLGVKAIAVKADVSVATEVDQVVRAAVDTFGRVDILVNNAGIVIRKNILDHTEDDWNKVMNINAKSVFLCSTQVARIMIKQGGGKIVNIASTFGQKGTRRGVYGPSKAAVINLTAALALELAPHRINVNAVCPGTISTPMSASMLKTPEILQRLLACIPCGRVGKPEDIASAVLFLSSEESNYLVGSVIVVDGGMFTTFSAF